MALADALATLVATRNKALLESLEGIGKGIGAGVDAYIQESRKTDAFDKANQLLKGKTEVDGQINDLETKLKQFSEAPRSKENLEQKAFLQQELNNMYVARDQSIQNRVGEGLSVLLRSGVDASSANLWANKAHQPTSNILLQSREQHAGAVDRAKLQHSYAKDLQKQKATSALAIKKIDLAAKAKKEGKLPKLSDKLRGELHIKKRLADEGHAIKEVWKRIKKKHFSATGPLGGRVPDLAVWDKDVQELRVRLDRYFSRYRKSITGSQAALKEIKLLLNEVPNKYDKVSTFESKMEAVFEEDRKDFIDYTRKVAEQNDVGSYLEDAKEYQELTRNTKQRKNTLREMMENNVPTEPSIMNPDYIEEANSQFKFH